MKITLLQIGKMQSKIFAKAFDDYFARLKHYVPFECVELPDLKSSKSLTTEQQKVKEGEMLLAQFAPSDKVVLLDERGTEHTSREFAGWLEREMAGGARRLVFVVGGPYGFSEAVYARANGKISLSRMTLTHEMVRLFFIEQIYRAMTILRNEPYHHD